MSSDPQQNPASDGNGDVPYEADDPKSAESESNQSDEGTVLDRVLKQTMSDLEAISDEESIAKMKAPSSDLPMLQEAAERFRGQTWGQGREAQGPIARALVEATLVWRFGHLCDDAETWRSISETISLSLLEDPHSRNRLQVLWTKLCESLT